jgi:hypothetical protein
VVTWPVRSPRRSTGWRGRPTTPTLWLADLGDGWLLDRPTADLVLTLSPSAFDGNRGEWGLALAQIHRIRGDERMARVYADSSEMAYAALIGATPGDPWLHMKQGLALAHLGRKAGALEAGERGAALLPIARDAVFGPQLQDKLVRLYLMVGETEKALDRLESLLEVPYFLSPAWLRVDPAFAVLRGNARFERLVEK